MRYTASAPFILFAILLGVVSSVARLAPPVERSGILTAHGMIITDPLPWKWEVKPGAFWVPTEKQVARADKALWCYFESPEAQAHLSKRLSQYQRQYLGVRRGGRACIECFLHIPWGQEDLTRPCEICDGGDAVFQIEYDLSTGQCSHFEPNGQA